MQDDLRPVRIYCKMKQRTERMNTMDWTEVAITVDAADVDRAGDIAQMVVPYGIYIEDYSHLEEEAWEIAHIDLIDEELLKKRQNQGNHSRLYQPGGKSGRSNFLLERPL